MAFIADYIFDLALAKLHVNATNLYICIAEPTMFMQPTSTYALGVKTSLNVGASAARTPSGL